MPIFCVYKQGPARVSIMWEVKASSEEEALATYKTKGIQDPSIDYDFEDYEVFAEEV